HLVEYTAEAEQIAARVDFPAVQLLRRHVLQCPDNLSLAREPGCQRSFAFLKRSALPGQSEVQQLDALFGHQNIRWLEVAMRDAFPVRGIQRVQDLPCVFGSFFQRKWTSQRSAFDHLHHQVIGTDIVEMANMGMVEGSDDVRLSREAFTEPSDADFD